MEVSVRCDECNVDNDQHQENMVCMGCWETLKTEKKELESKVESLEEEIKNLENELQEKE